MSRVPTGTGFFSTRPMNFASRSAIGTPRRRIPTSPKSSEPPFFSMISCARRTSVRSISDEDMSCAFWRSPDLGAEFLVAMTGLHHTRPRLWRARTLGRPLHSIESFTGLHKFCAERFKLGERFAALFRVQGLDRVFNDRDRTAALEQAFSGEADAVLGDYTEDKDLRVTRQLVDEFVHMLGFEDVERLLLEQDLLMVEDIVREFRGSVIWDASNFMGQRLVDILAAGRSFNAMRWEGCELGIVG